MGALAAALYLTGCATTIPDWVDNPATVYSQQQYLSAMGSADERQTAADRALANLAKIFEVQVTESSLDFSSAQVSSGAEGAVTSNEQRLSRTISTEARQVVEGAKVVEYYETEQGRVHALAILDKQAAASRFRHSILEADRKIDHLMAYAEHQASNPVAALAALNQAHLTQMSRDQMQRNLLVVADGQGINTPYSTAMIEDTIRQALASLRVAIEADDPAMKMELQRAVGRLGMQIDPASNLRFTGLRDTTPPERRQGWYWIRGSYELVFTDGNTVIGKQRWPVKASATDESLVGQRLRDSLNQRLPRQLFEMLTTTVEQ